MCIEMNLYFLFLIYYIITDLLLFAKLLELLAINHSSSERSIIFVLRLLSSPIFWLFYNLDGGTLSRG